MGDSFFFFSRVSGCFHVYLFASLFSVLEVIFQCPEILVSCSLLSRKGQLRNPIK